MKSLKIPKGVNRARTDNKINQKTKRKRIIKKKKPNNTTLKTRLSIKTGDEIRCSGKFTISCPTSGTHRVTVVYN